MCDMYSYQKVKFEIKITWRFYDSYVSFDETRYTLLLHDVYEVLISFFWVPQRVEHNYSGRWISIRSKIQWNLLIHIYR